MFGQTNLATWNFTGCNGAVSQTAGTVATGISNTSAVITRGAGYTADSYGGNSFGGYNINKTTLVDAISANDYLSFTITPAAGKKIDVTSISTRLFSQTQIRSFSLFSSVNGFAANNVIATTSGTGVVNYTFALTGHTNLTSAVEFRVYFYGSTDMWTHAAFGDYFAHATTNDIVIVGSVSDVTPLATWNFTGCNGAATKTASTVATGIAATTTFITRGAGYSADSYGGNSFGGYNIDKTTLVDAISANDYLSFTITPSAGKKISISSIKFRPCSQTQTRTFALFSSVTGFSAANVMGSGTALTNWGGIEISIPVSAINNVTSAVEFRIYMYGSTDMWTNASLGAYPAHSTTDDLVISGTTADSYTNVTFNPNSLPELELGLGGFDYYSTPRLANCLAMENRNWMDNTTNATIYQNSGQLNANGYPKYLNPGQILVARPGQNTIGDNPAKLALYNGKVVLTWIGDADIRVEPLSNSVTNPANATGSIVNGRREYLNSSNFNGYNVKIYAINPNNPPTKIRVWMPDPTSPSTKSLEPLAGQPEPIFHPTYLDAINKSQYSVYRFMDMGHTNASPCIDWVDHRPKDHCFQDGVINRRNSPGWDNTWGDAEMGTGASYETMIALCNQTNKDMWVCVPHAATNDYVTKMAQLIAGKDPDGTGAVGLNSNLKVYLEYSNEIWAEYSNGFCQGTYARTMANAAGLSNAQWVARRYCQVWNIFQKEFNSNARIVRVLGTFTANSTYTTGLLAEMASYGPTLQPATQADALAVSTYFGNNIEQYVFENMDYTTITTAKIDQVYKEWEQRLLSDEATSNGQDFTGGGGGVPAEQMVLAVQYNLPVVAYEGGTGLPLANFVSVKDCKVVPNGTSGSTFGELCRQACNGDLNFQNFMYAVQRDPRLADMFKIHNSLAKAKGVRMVTQFGDITPMNKYGYWGFREFVNQAPTQKETFWYNWQIEQSTIREKSNPLGAVPSFTTSGELYPAKVNQAYSKTINYGGGNGAISISLVGYGVLPTGLSFSYQTNQVTISGTPTVAGTYRFAFRLLDADKDPAYGVFTLKVLPAPMNAIFASDNFGTVATDLNALNSGTGFSSAWSVQGGNGTLYQAKTTTPLSYSGLLSSGGAYGQGGFCYQTAGRGLNTSAFNYLTPSTDPTQIGQSNSSLWFSGLFRRNVGAEKNQFIYFCNNWSVPDATKSKVRVGVLANGNFALYVRNAANTDFDVVDAGVSAVTQEGKTTLIVVQFQFDANADVVRLFINPTQLGGAAPAANATYTYANTTTNNLTINTFALYGGTSSTVVQMSFDDLRFGDTYAAVTPVLKNQIAEVSDASSIRLYPNPATDYINIDMQNNDNAQITISNLQGQILRRYNETSNNVLINTSELTTGLYIVTIKNQDKVETIRFVKQ